MLSAALVFTDNGVLGVGEDITWRACTRGFFGEPASSTIFSNFSLITSPGSAIGTADEFVMRVESLSPLTSSGEMNVEVIFQTGELSIQPSSSNTRSSISTKCLTTSRGSYFKLSPGVRKRIRGLRYRARLGLHNALNDLREFVGGKRENMQNSREAKPFVFDTIRSENHLDTASQK